MVWFFKIDHLNDLIYDLIKKYSNKICDERSEIYLTGS
ncbi:hypothetical protein ADICYQ_3358 [Cyclobacterium qasimii M12-11B]|uniref:Uncharacterized protein n=1 Tax=Cyclobacterium qasimii M12-11B TaxID=641524 RepID=S7VBG1_9BACT|nr:hypothetical protein ADICYQ_3358 [Cyclobacterium qasimii M12-11B]